MNTLGFCKIATRQQQACRHVTGCATAQQARCRFCMQSLVAAVASLGAAHLRLQHVQCRERVGQRAVRTCA